MYLITYFERDGLVKILEYLHSVTIVGIQWGNSCYNAEILITLPIYSYNVYQVTSYRRGWAKGCLAFFLYRDIKGNCTLTSYTMFCALSQNYQHLFEK